MATVAAPTNVIGKVVQVAGPAVDCQFPEGQIPEVFTAIRITSEGFDVPTPIDIICETAQHIGEGGKPFAHWRGFVIDDIVDTAAALDGRHCRLRCIVDMEE